MEDCGSCPGPISYSVQTADGQVWHRHVDQMRDTDVEASAEPVIVPPNQDIDNLSIPMDSPETIDQPTEMS